MLLDVIGALVSIVYFSVFALFIIKKKNIFYPKYEGPLAVMQGIAGIVGGILWVTILFLIRR